MNTEKAIETIRRVFNFVPSFIGTSEQRESVIKLIEELEKYKKIVEETEQFLEPGVIMEIPEELMSSRHIDIIKYTFEKIKQKYFPRVYKRKWVIELETTDVHAIRNADSAVRNRFNGREYFGCDLKIKEDRG